MNEHGPDVAGSGLVSAGSWKKKNLRIDLLPQPVAEQQARDGGAAYSLEADGLAGAEIINPASEAQLEDDVLPRADTPNVSASLASFRDGKTRWDVLSRLKYKSFTKKGGSPAGGQGGVGITGRRRCECPPGEGGGSGFVCRTCGGLIGAPSGQQPRIQLPNAATPRSAPAQLALDRLIQRVIDFSTQKFDVTAVPRVWLQKRRKAIPHTWDKRLFLILPNERIMRYYKEVKENGQLALKICGAIELTSVTWARRGRDVLEFEADIAGKEVQRQQFVLKPFGSRSFLEKNGEPWDLQYGPCIRWSEAMEQQRKLVERSTALIKMAERNGPAREKGEANSAGAESKKWVRTSSLLLPVPEGTVVVISGWMLKQKKDPSRDWERRMFVLTDEFIMRYFQEMGQENSWQLKGEISLYQIRITEEKDEGGGPETLVLHAQQINKWRRRMFRLRAMPDAEPSPSVHEWAAVVKKMRSHLYALTLKGGSPSPGITNSDVFATQGGNGGGGSGGGGSSTPPTSSLPSPLPTASPSPPSGRVDTPALGASGTRVFDTSGATRLFEDVELSPSANDSMNSQQSIPEGGVDYSEMDSVSMGSKSRSGSPATAPRQAQGAAQGAR